MTIETADDSGNLCAIEYKKDPKIKSEDIQLLLDWIKKQAHLPKIEELLVIHFYNAAEYSLQRAKELIELHYNFRNDAPEFFTGKGYLPPQYSHNEWDITYLCDFPHHTKEGYRLVYCGFKDSDSSKFNLKIELAIFVKCLLAILYDRGTCDGYAFVFDMQGVTIGHLATFTISLAQKFLYFAQEAVPLKVRQVNVINATPLIEKIMFLIKPFLKKELYEMIKIDSDMSNFFKRVPPELIPTDLGGTLPHTRPELTDLMKLRLDRMEDKLSYLLQQKSMKTKSNDAEYENANMEILNKSYQLYKSVKEVIKQQKNFLL